MELMLISVTWDLCQILLKLLVIPQMDVWLAQLLFAPVVPLHLLSIMASAAQIRSISMELTVFLTRLAQPLHISLLVFAVVLTFISH